MPKYVSISWEEMKSFVMTLTKNKAKLGVIGRELVFCYHLKNNPDLAIDIYTTFDYGTYGYSRGAGEDSIKVILFNLRENENVGGRKRINRTENWRKRLKEKFLDLGLKVNQYKCSCGGFFKLRMPKKNEKPFGVAPIILNVRILNPKMNYLN